jgi:hypothetical protein
MLSLAVSGRRNTRDVLKLARMLNKPAFPLGTIDGAERSPGAVRAATTDCRWEAISG